MWRALQWNFPVSAKQTSLEYTVTVTFRVNGLGHINIDRNTLRKLIDFQMMLHSVSLQTVMSVKTSVLAIEAFKNYHM